MKLSSYFIVHWFDSPCDNCVFVWSVYTSLHNGRKNLLIKNSYPLISATDSIDNTVTFYAEIIAWSMYNLLSVCHFIHVFLQIFIIYSLSKLQNEWRFLLAGGTIIPNESENPAKDWLSERSWREILMLSNLVSSLEKLAATVKVILAFIHLFLSPWI